MEDARNTSLSIIVWHQALLHQMSICLVLEARGSSWRSTRVVRMLPDTLQNLPRDERYAYARLLAYMARVDEEITVDELAMFEQQLGKALLSPNQRDVLRRSLKSPPTLEECLDGLGPEAGRLALRDAVLMAASDGSVDDDELEVLKEIAEHLGLVPDAVQQLIDWTKTGYAWMQDGYDLLNSLQG